MKNPDDLSKRKVLVACRSETGIPMMYPATVHVSDGGFEKGHHYQKAERQARDEGYELPSGSRVCIDEQDAQETGQTDLMDAAFGESHQDRLAQIVSSCLADAFDEDDPHAESWAIDMLLEKAEKLQKKSGLDLVPDIVFSNNDA